MSSSVSESYSIFVHEDTALNEFGFFFPYHTYSEHVFSRMCYRYQNARDTKGYNIMLHFRWKEK